MLSVDHFAYNVYSLSIKQYSTVNRVRILHGYALVSNLYQFVAVYITLELFVYIVHRGVARH